MPNDTLSLFPIDDVEPSALGPAALNQYFTPRWVADLIVRQYFPDIDTPGTTVLDPSAGDGSWLRAIPAHINAIGIEIDPTVAAIAAHDTGRRIIIGDFTTVDIDIEPTHILGNPPYTSTTIAAFIQRTNALLPHGGKAGFILPAYVFSFARTTLALLRNFDVRVDILPRDIFPRISQPLIFARLTKNHEQRLIGFMLFEEAAAVHQMRSTYRRIIERGRKPIWRDLIETALHAYGGQATLNQIYALIEGFRPTSNRWWKDAIRREAATHCIRLDRGVFKLRHTTSA